MRSFVRFSLIGLVVLVAIGFALNQQTDGDGDEVAATVSNGICFDNGTSLVVDFGTGQKQPLIEKCVANFTGFSWDLFEEASIAVTGTEKYPVGFVCRVENFPNQEQDKCKDTPKDKTGRWAYFLSDDLGNWKYSPIGAATHRVECGQGEGWRFLMPGEPMDTFPRASLNTYVCNN